MDAGRHKICRSKTKDIMIHCTGSSRSYMLHQLPLTPKSQIPWARCGIAPGNVHAVRLQFSEGTSVLGNLPNLCPEEDLFITLARKQCCSLLQKELLSLFQGCLLYNYPWEDSPEQKLWQDLQKREGPMRNDLPTLLCTLLRNYVTLLPHTHFSLKVKLTCD